MQAATVLVSLCKENELRVKVLLGGCFPPLLGLLKSSSAECQTAATKTIYAVSQGGSKDHVRSQILTAGVVSVFGVVLPIKIFRPMKFYLARKGSALLTVA
eukprot:TRINITY_DN2687_c0_g1_i10.p1 TRINITY_DN2687_c0_g1~~TRINITY_DN2687_c0_g1_i10.p1  ORF type:complete len:101 (-),score=21.16 TRINITY_DN2687_c0_g1_i10:116-418(-)